MGFLSGLITATVKTVLTPLVVVKDVVTGDLPEGTADHVEDIVDDISESLDDLADGDLI